MRSLKLILLLIALLYGQEVYANLCSEDERVVSKECRPCPDSMANEAGDDPTGPDTACSKCAFDYYVASNECKHCPPGTKNNVQDNVLDGNTTCAHIL